MPLEDIGKGWLRGRVKDEVLVDRGLIRTWNLFDRE